MAKELAEATLQTVLLSLLVVVAGLVIISSTLS
jgi:hypothetical protein